MTGNFPRCVRPIRHVVIDAAAAPVHAWTAYDTAVLGALLGYAIVLRLLFFNGFFGSDDLVYLARSVQIAEGVWTSANYNGSLRYGYNIPAGLFIYLFGLNTFTANLWTLVSSVAEVGVVYAFARRYFGRRSAVFAALILASLPLHIALATRIHADAVLALFLTLAFVLFYRAEETGRPLLYAAAGLALGMVFWVKELAAVTLLAFMSYPLLAGRLRRGWLFVVAGGLVMLVAHLVLMQIIAGHPLHLMTTVTSQLQEGVRGDGYTDSPGYYFRYLFANIRHTWIAAFLAAFAIAALAWRHHARDRVDATLYTAWWLIALLVVMSFTPVSLDPLRFAMKQSNYLNLFLAPIALLGGWFLAGLRRRTLAHAVLALTLVGGVAIGAVAQHAYRSFTANSRAVVEFVRAHPEFRVLGTTNNRNMVRVAALLDDAPALGANFGLLDEAWTAAPAPTAGDTRALLVVFDRETLDWARHAPGPSEPPPCWRAVAVLQPTYRDAGYWLLDGALAGAAVLPAALRTALEPRLRRHRDPQRATLYRAPPDDLRCDRAGSRA